MSPRRIHPFLSFAIESARILKNAVKERPLSLAGSMLTPYLLTQMAMNLLGLRDDDKDNVLKDMRGKLIFKGMTGDWPAFAMLLPFRSEGKLAQFDLANVNPFATILGRPLETGKEEDFVQYVARRLLTASPVGNLLTAFGTNQNPFSGRHITEADMTPAERALARAKYAWNLMAPPLAMGTGFQQVATSFERSTNKTLEKRSTGQAFLRAVMGLDVRNASPDLYRLAEDFRSAHGMQTDDTWSGGTTAQQRARQQLFGQLAQDTPDPERVAGILTFLKQSGKPVETQQDINRLLFYRNPIMLIGANQRAGTTGAENQARFRASLTGESRKVLEDALAEFRKIQARTPRVIGEARRLMKPTAALPMPTIGR